MITLYDLEDSRGRRVEWVLRLLNLKYRLELYHRDEDSRAPPAFKEVWSTGKFPVLRDGEQLIAESGFIVTYLIQKYGKDTDLLGATDQEKIDVGYGVTASESNLQIFQMMLLIHQKARTKLPWAISGVGRKILDQVDASYPLPGLEGTLDELEARVKQNGGFYTGGHLTAADVMYEFILPKIRARKYFDDFERKWPELVLYQARLEELYNKEATKKQLRVEFVDHK